MNSILLEQLAAYVPADRLCAMTSDASLPTRSQGAALFVDIAGFTALTDALVADLGPQRGAEELTFHLNRVYDSVIDTLHRYGGSAISFAGDAVTCWMADDDGVCAVACALAIQEAMAPFSSVATPSGDILSLSVKVAVTTGPVRRFQVGNPDIRVIDVLAGKTLVRLAEDEHLATSGEVVMDEESAAALGDALVIAGSRTDLSYGFSITIIEGLAYEVTPRPWPQVNFPRLSLDALARWLPAPVRTRLEQGLGEFLAELRPTVALMLRFDGIDFDGDEQAGQKLDAYIRWVQQIVLRYDGTLIDLNIGDKGSYLYINFGAPLAHEDSILRAASTALELQQSSAYLPYITSVQIGVSQGTMRAGAYGGAAHRTYGVLGPEVNIAARLMMKAAPQQILFSQGAQDAAVGAFRFQEVGPFELKGRTGPTPAYALLDARRTQGARLLSATTTTPMVGRRRELVVLSQQLDHLSERSGQIATVVGEAGIGKTRLVIDFVRLASERDIYLLGGECQSYGANTAYLAWQPVWQNLLGMDLSQDVATQISGLEERLAGIDAELISRLPLLGPLLNIEIPENALTTTFDAKLRKSSLESLLVELLRSLARLPMLVVLEDCHWLDPLSADLVEVIGRAITDLPVMLLLTSRTLDDGHLRAASFANLPNITEIVLKPLDISEIAEFVHLKLSQLYGIDGEAGSAVAARVSAQAEGIPFFIDELINYMYNAGIDPTDADGITGLDLPDSVHHLVNSRLDQLDEHSKSVMKVASVIGRTFEAGWLVRVYPPLGKEEHVEASIHRLEEANLIERDRQDRNATCFFRQAIVQGATYESLPYSMRCDLHEQTGRYIEERFVDGGERYIDLLAHHYDRSENMDKRREYLRRAGEAAQAAYANEAAVDYYERLIALTMAADQIDVLLRLGEVLLLVGRWDESARRFQAALAAAIESKNKSQTGWCHVALGELWRKQGRYPESYEQFERATAQFVELDDAIGLGQVLHYSGSLAAQQGEYEKAKANYTESLAIRRQLADRRNEAGLLSNLGIIARFQNEYEEAQRLHQLALTIRRELGDQWAIAVSLNNLGNVALDQNEYDIARTYLEETISIMRRTGDQLFIATGLNNLGNIVRSQSDYVHAMKLYEDALVIYSRLGSTWEMANLLDDISILAALEHKQERALIIHGAATSLRDSLGASRSGSEERMVNEALTPIVSRLSAEAITQMVSKGSALSLAEVTDYVQMISH